MISHTKIQNKVNSSNFHFLTNGLKWIELRYWETNRFQGMSLGIKLFFWDILNLSMSNVSLFLCLFWIFPLEGQKIEMFRCLNECMRVFLVLFFGVLWLKQPERLPVRVQFKCGPLLPLATLAQCAFGLASNYGYSRILSLCVLFTILLSGIQ